MRTKFEVGQSVYCFDPNEERIAEVTIEMIIVNDKGVFYRIGEVVLPEKQLFSCELQCKEYYRKIFL